MVKPKLLAALAGISTHTQQAADLGAGIREYDIGGSRKIRAIWQFSVVGLNALSSRHCFDIVSLVTGRPPSEYKSLLFFCQQVLF